MLVVHGIWAYGAVQLWAEDPALPADAPARVGRPGHPGRPSRAPRPHPFAVTAADLADALAELPDPVSGLARKAVDDEIALRLPTIGDGPLASPEAGREPPAGRVTLAAWRVPALVFEPSDAVPALTVLGAAGESFRELVPGATLAYLASVAGFAGDLMTRGRVLPVLVAEDDGYAARWRPVLGAADAQRARELAAAMPPLCRAAGDAAAGPVLAEALDAFADAAARGRLQAPLLPARRGRRPARIDLPERIVAALTGSTARVEVETPQDVAEARSLAAALGEWLASARLPAGPARTCFRLVEPEEDAAQPGDAWRVEVALQSADDPSLMLPAAEVWDGAGAGWLGGDVYPDEELLTGLGAAARLFPALEGALREAAPTEVALDTAGALRFLREEGPLLAGAGFGVLLPDWARKARLGLKLTARSTPAASSPSARLSAFGMQDLVEFRYDLAV